MKSSMTVQLEAGSGDDTKPDAMNLSGWHVFGTNCLRSTDLFLAGPLERAEVIICTSFTL